MICLKELNPKNISKSYVKWMNDYEVHKFTEQKNKKHNLKGVTKFIKDIKNSKNEFLYGIFLKNNKEHIGNIKLGPTDFVHKRAYISYFIGNKNYLKKGYASMAVSEIIKIAKKKGLKKLQAGSYEMNYASNKVLEKNKFKLEGILKSQILFNNKRYKSYLYGLVL